MSTVRPIYENHATLAAEAALAKRVAAAWDVRLEKLPVKYRVDFVGLRGGIPLGWFEVKCRNHRSDRFDTYMLSLDKWMMGQRLQAETAVPFVLAVGFVDTSLFLEARPSLRVRHGWGGRTDRGDWQDKEPCVFIDIGDFITLS